MHPSSNILRTYEVIIDGNMDTKKIKLSLEGIDIGNNEVGQWIQVNFSDIFGLWYNIVFGLLIIVFTFFYTAITVPTNKMSDDLKRSGGFVPGIRPGNETSDFLDNVMSQITFPGSLFLAALAVFPAIVVKLMGMQQGWALFYLSLIHI